MITIILRLLWIHIFAFTAICLGSFIPGLDFMISALYLVVVAAEAGAGVYRSFWGRLMMSIFWQAPGYLLGMILLFKWQIAGIYENAIFMLEFWATPIVPWLSLLPKTHLPYPLYYYGLWVAPVLFTAWSLALSYTKINPLAVHTYEC